MRAWLYAAAGSTALALAACTPPHAYFGHHGAMRQITALDCPQEEGDLKLKAGTASARTCVYDTEGGDEVTLQLIDLNGSDPHAALASMETSLQAELPQAVVPDKPAAGASASSSSWSTSSDDKDKDKDKVDIDLPGIHIHGRGDGQSDVDMPGVHVRANDHDSGHGDAQVTVGAGGHGGVVVNAHEGSAQIRVDEPGSGVRLDYMLQSDKPGPHGYRLAAYEARGPADGPIVVAKMLGKGSDDEDLRHDVRVLMRQNVGG